MALGKLHKEIEWGGFKASQAKINIDTLELFELNNNEIIDHIVIPNI